MPNQFNSSEEHNELASLNSTNNPYGEQYPLDPDDEFVKLLKIDPEWNILSIGHHPMKYAKTVIDPNYEDIDLCHLPFKDEEFDYVVCRNLLQRQSNPVEVSKELSRVAKRGLIEVPNKMNEHLFGHPQDQWICEVQNQQLVFNKKTYARHPLRNIGKKIYHSDRVFQQNYEQNFRNLFFIQFQWNKSIDCKLNADVDTSISEEDNEESTRQCSTYLDCALNCISFNIPELNEEISFYLNMADNVLPGNKLTYTLRELHQHKSSMTKETFSQLLEKFQNMNLVDTLQKKQKNEYTDSTEIDKSHYPVIKSIYEKNKSHPLVSIIIRTFNRDVLLARCLDSIDEQFYTNIEVIIVNDGGDNVSSLLEHRKFPCHYISHGENKGKAASLNTGLQMARGKYINIVDDDDLIYPDHIALLVTACEQSKHRVAYANSLMSISDYIDGEWRSLTKQLIFSQYHDLQLLLQTNYLPILSVLFEKSLLEECGFVDERFQVLEDWDLWIRFALVTDFYYVKKITSEYHQRAEGDNATQNSIGAFDYGRKLIQQKYGKHTIANAVPETAFYQSIQKKKLLGFLYIAETFDETREVIYQFANEFYDIPWAELAIAHHFSEEREIELHDELKMLSLTNQISFYRSEKSANEGVHLNQFDFIIQYMSDSSTSLNQSPDKQVPIVSHLNLKDTVKTHPLFGHIYRSDKHMPLVSLIILTMNQVNYTKRCIESIYRHTRVPFELIIVDNGSTDGTRAYLNQISSRYDNIKLILNEENKGYGGGNNQGLAYSKGDYVVIMNNDVIVTKDWIQGLLNTMDEHPNCGIVGPVSNHVAGYQYINDPLYDLDRLDSYAENHKKTFQGQTLVTDRVIGFCMIAKREVIEHIGGFDLRFIKGNFEDDDFCIRTKLAGYEIVVAKEVFVHHFGSVTFNHNESLDYEQIYHQNFFKFIDKWKISIPEDGVFRGWSFADISIKTFNITKHYQPFIADESLESYMNHVTELFQNKDYIRSEVVLLQCRETHGDLPVIHYNLLVNYMQTKNIEQAAECFKHLDEEIVEVGHLKIIWYVWTKQRDSAQKLMEKLLKKAPNHPQLLTAKTLFNKSN